MIQWTEDFTGPCAKEYLKLVYKLTWPPCEQSPAFQSIMVAYTKVGLTHYKWVEQAAKPLAAVISWPVSSEGRGCNAPVSGLCICKALWESTHIIMLGMTQTLFSSHWHFIWIPKYVSHSATDQNSFGFTRLLVSRWFSPLQGVFTTAISHIYHSD